MEERSALDERWVFLALALMFLGGVVTLLAALPAGVESVLEQHGPVALLVLGGAYTLWIADPKRASLYFGVVFGASAALVDPSQLFAGCVGLALTAAARFLQLKLRLS